MHFNDGLWAFLPKGEQEDDGSTGPGFVERLPSETRSLTMKNTDNKLIAAAVTYASIPTFKKIRSIAYNRVLCLADFFWKCRAN